MFLLCSFRLIEKNPRLTKVGQEKIKDGMIPACMRSRAVLRASVRAGACLCVDCFIITLLIEYSIILFAFDFI